MIVTSEGWKLSLRDRDLNELYNLNDYTVEDRNLYSERKFQTKVEELRKQIHRWQVEGGDKLRI